MKSDFEKFSGALSIDDVERGNRLYRDVLVHLRRYPSEVIPFLYSKQPTILMTNRIMSLTHDAMPRQWEDVQEEKRWREKHDAVQKTVVNIIKHVRKAFWTKLNNARQKDGSDIPVSLSKLDRFYLEDVANRMNSQAFRDAAADIVSALSGVYEDNIVPVIEEESRSWRGKHYNPPILLWEQDNFAIKFNYLADSLFVEPDEVFNFINDIQEDGNTISTNMFEEVLFSLGVKDLYEENQLYALFEERINIVKNFFKTYISREYKEGRMSLSSDDEKWNDVALMVNTALDEVAYDIAEIAERTGGRFMAAVYSPSIQR